MNKIPSWKKYELKWPKRVKASRRAYYLKNKERIYAMIQEWKLKNRNKYLESKRRYYFKIKGKPYIGVNIDKKRIGRRSDNEKFYAQTIRELGL